jgi:hypothetical protein
MSEESHISHFHYLQSKDRSSGEAVHSANLRANQFDKVYAFNVSSIQIPYTWYTFNANTNKIDFEVNSSGTTLTAVLPIGNYNIVSLLPAIKAAMELVAAPRTYTVTQSDLTSKITITQDSLVFRILGTGTANRLIGFGTSNTSNAIAQIAPNIFNLSGSTYIDIFSDKLTNHGSHLSDSSGSGAGRLARVPVSNYKFGDTIHFSPNYATFNHDGHKLNTVDLKLVDEYGHPVDLNGRDYWMKLKYSSRYTHLNEDVETLANKN